MLQVLKLIYIKPQYINFNNWGRLHVQSQYHQHCVQPWSKN